MHFTIYKYTFKAAIKMRVIDKEEQAQRVGRQ